MISEGSEADHDTGFVGPFAGIFLISTDEDQKGGHDKHVDQINPQIGAVSGIFY